MCWERAAEKLRATQIRATESPHEDEVEWPETWREPKEEPEEVRERDKEYAGV